jgi:hypothetical protein
MKMLLWHPEFQTTGSASSRTQVGDGCGIEAGNLDSGFRIAGNAGDHVIVSPNVPRPTIQLLPNELVTESAEPRGFDEKTRGDPPFHLKRKKVHSSQEHYRCITSNIVLEESRSGTRAWFTKPVYRFHQKLIDKPKKLFFL